MTLIDEQPVLGRKITVDTGGTFTDVVVSAPDGTQIVGKAPTEGRAFGGVREALTVVADEVGETVPDLLAGTSLFIYSTTRSTNAILEGKTAKTALLVTAGFPDVLVLREGGKLNPFDMKVQYPEPYVPKALTREITERIDAEGEVVTPLDEDAARATLRELSGLGVEAVAVCLLWSVANHTHELRLAELISEELPGVPYTLSHVVNPVVREYRRASSAAIDASIKPLMGDHLRQFAEDLVAEGFAGELMIATSQGGVRHVDDVAARPIDTVRSGPSLAPVAGKVFAAHEHDGRDVIVCDTGGTSFDVSLVRRGAISYARDTWLGPQFTGHLTGVSSVDIRSIGSGGGSIAHIDAGGLLRVGPESAGAYPGPACYGRGGTLPTVTDAAVVLGYIDPGHFLGGRMHLDRVAAEAAISTIAAPLGFTPTEAAAAILRIANEHMVSAIQDITVNEGVDPRESMIVAGGGAAGIGIASIAQELGCTDVLVPRAAGALSATGGQYSDIAAEFAVSLYADTAQWDAAAVSEALGSLDAQVEELADALRARGLTHFEVEYLIDARYAYQVWDLEVPVQRDWFNGTTQLGELKRAFDEAHETVFAVTEPGAAVQCLSWKARLKAPVGATSAPGGAAPVGLDVAELPTRPAFFDGDWHEAVVIGGGTLAAGTSLSGPAIVVEPTSTLVVPPSADLRITPSGNYHLTVKASS